MFHFSHQTHYQTLIAILCWRSHHAELLMVEGAYVFRLITLRTQRKLDFWR